MKEIVYYATGRRKTSSSRIFLKNGNGKIVINNIDLKKYFNREIDILNILNPINILNLNDKIDCYITVKGGGNTGQSESIRLGISRALIKYDYNYKKILKDVGYLTRDSRIVERKKYGFKKSRKRPQFSKR
ncbi:30S ribosomal protein S9 [endosymbiont of Sipalinus gigas]|uniref:30S ribosomal protein S9 n=1 Tax=endosymbiont of Sipalinus gigas TaxID=1972134 RepID=UPI000DC72A3A|nr:30S ribosomal protein S9 [endosymbiont of Sipalinus gigas]BBA85308.1 30S ribosomal protein S9 [endosymbiont of Sipalinus gigas]